MTGARKGFAMAKLLYCKDVGFDCDHEIRADNEEELLTQVVQHAGEVHGLTDITPEVVAQVKAAIREA